MSKPLKILYATAELAPFASTGGLGDVAASLPRSLAALGHDVRVVLPCYRHVPKAVRMEPGAECRAVTARGAVSGTLCVAAAPDSQLPLYLVQNDAFFDRPHIYGPRGEEYPDALERFCFFSMAALNGLAKMDWAPDVVHCNDWHTAIIPAHIKTRPAQHASWATTATLFTIHNLAYQGIYPASKMAETGLPESLFTPDGLEFYGKLNLMKAGIGFADRINAVSPRYAREILTEAFGFGLEGFLQTRAAALSGVLNGIDYDDWNPATDPYIYQNYSVHDLSGKAACKNRLQLEFDLPESDGPLVGMVSRINWQKGFDLLPAAIEDTLGNNAQFFLLGSGDRALEKACGAIARRHPDHVRAVFQYAPALARNIYAASDFFLMPSRYEPCGLSQMYALAYGAVPIVRRTGGLADTVHPITAQAIEKSRATGLVFNKASSAAIRAALARALALFQDRRRYCAVQVTGMNQRFSWTSSARHYVSLYRKAISSK